eukprot:6176474-Pleurochrysis_carterae.AAC.1
MTTRMSSILHGRSIMIALECSCQVKKRCECNMILFCKYRSRADMWQILMTGPKELANGWKQVAELLDAQRPHRSTRQSPFQTTLGTEKR